MAMSASNLAGAGDSANLASYATASITPTANALVLIAVENQLSGTPTIPTVTGCGLTWVQISTCLFDNTFTQARITVFRTLGASPTTGTLTIDFGGVAQSCAGWTVDQFTGVDTTGTDGSGAIVQSAKTAEPAAAATTSVTATLGSAITSGNAAWTAASWEASETGTAEAGWTALGEGTHASPPDTVKSSWRNASDDNSATTSWTTSALAGAIIVEIKDGAAAPVLAPRMMTSLYR
ncbi:MAG: hypothetical protein M3R61_00155 [Chloroflexota bacterium]|nr:hypothetical protein [Chloroflexota bacterium]